MRTRERKGKLPESVWAYHGAAPGPVAAVVGGVHGNELAGIGVIALLKRKFDSGELVPARGSVLLAIGNPEAVAAGTRSTDEDLNRCFTAAALAGEGASRARRRARDLAAAFDGVAFGIDIHGTNVPSRPFIVIQRERRDGDAAVLGRLSAGIVLRDPRMVFAGEPSTLDELFSAGGGMGVCYETGAAGDVASVESVAGEVVDALAGAGWLDGGKDRPAWTVKEEFVLREAVILTEDGFRYADGVGNANFQPIARGSVIGYRGAEPVRASSDCLLVFPKPERYRILGAPVGYLAVRA